MADRRRSPRVPRFVGDGWDPPRGGPCHARLRIFVLKSGHIKEPAKIISCPDDEAATEEAQQMPDGADQTLEVWQSDRRVTVIGLKIAPASAFGSVADKN